MPAGAFSGDYDLRRYPGMPVGIFWYEPNEFDPLKFARPGGGTVTLAERFLTDLASTPRIVWPVHGLAPQDMERPSLVHDWLYTAHHQGRDVYDFRESNRVLQEACLTEGYSRPMAWSIRVACDLFGRSIWDRKEDPVPSTLFGAPARELVEKGWSVKRHGRGA